MRVAADGETESAPGWIKAALSDAFRQEHIGARRRGPLSVYWKWTAAAAVIVVVGVTALLLSTQPTGQPIAPGLDPNPAAPDARPSVERPPALTPPSKKSVRPERPRVARTPRRSRDGEPISDFVPLTYVAQSAAVESGQVVRVSIPRSTLISLGLPMNIDRAGDVVKADLVVGDDGVARAIRLVQQ
jgi:hypothetical protein